MASKPPKNPLKSRPDDDEQVDVLMSLDGAPDHAVAITAAAYLDYAVELLLRNALRECEPDEERRLFESGANSILATTSAKITMGYAMRLYEQQTRDDMRTVNKVRNIFAHSMHQITFQHDAVVAECRKLSLIQRRSDMFQDPINIDARKVYWNTCLDLFFAAQWQVRGILHDGSIKTAAPSE